MKTRFSLLALAPLVKFSHIGVFSGGSIALTNITDVAAFKEKVKLVFVSYGSREVDPNRPGGGAEALAATPGRTARLSKRPG